MTSVHKKWLCTKRKHHSPSFTCNSYGIARLVALGLAVSQHVENNGWGWTPTVNTIFLAFPSHQSMVVFSPGMNCWKNSINLPQTSHIHVPWTPAPPFTILRMMMMVMISDAWQAGQNYKFIKVNSSYIWVRGETILINYCLSTSLDMVLRQAREGWGGARLPRFLQ